MKYLHEKIPILIRYLERGLWSVEIADNYKEYIPAYQQDINFEDVLFHFHIPIWNGFDERSVTNYFSNKKIAISVAKYVNETYLNNKGEIIQ
jgi:hypothetical protein